MQRCISENGFVLAAYQHQHTCNETMTTMALPQAFSRIVNCNKTDEKCIGFDYCNNILNLRSLDSRIGVFPFRCNCSGQFEQVSTLKFRLAYKFSLDMKIYTIDQTGKAVRLAGWQANKQPTPFFRFIGVFGFSFGRTTFRSLNDEYSWILSKKQTMHVLLCGYAPTGIASSASCRVHNVHSVSQPSRTVAAEPAGRFTSMEFPCTTREASFVFIYVSPLRLPSPPFQSLISHAG